MASSYTDMFKDALFPRKRPIVYTLTRTRGGWRVSAYVPPTAPATDRMTVVRWLGEYKNQVKRAQPEWLVRFKAEDQCHFELDVMPTHGFARGKGSKVQMEEFENAWRQLSFDYA